MLPFLDSLNELPKPQVWATVLRLHVHATFDDLIQRSPSLDMYPAGPHFTLKGVRRIWRLPEQYAVAPTAIQSRYLNEASYLAHIRSEARPRRVHPEVRFLFGGIAGPNDLLEQFVFDIFCDKGRILHIEDPHDLVVRFVRSEIDVSMKTVRVGDSEGVMS